MADDPVQGFGQRIISRARLPTAALLSIPLLAVAAQYFFFLAGHGFTLNAALDRLNKDWVLISFVAAVPAAFLALSRELQLHAFLDKLVGARRDVDNHITHLMANLAREAGYDHPERITSDPQGALRWFYVYANQPSALRTYVFEVWEGYYVGLYLSLASLIAVASCAFLLLFFPTASVAPFLIFSLLVFIALWGIRRWKTVPKLMRILSQQIEEIAPGAEILREARRRFD